MLVISLKISTAAASKEPKKFLGDANGATLCHGNKSGFCESITRTFCVCWKCLRNKAVIMFWSSAYMAYYALSGLHFVPSLQSVGLQFYPNLSTYKQTVLCSPVVADPEISYATYSEMVFIRKSLMLFMLFSERLAFHTFKLTYLCRVYKRSARFNLQGKKT